MKKRYPIRKPLYAAGIRLQEPKKASREWWMKRWLDSLASKDLENRFSRGKIYASTGQITKLEIDINHIEAEVLGARKEPYKVSIDFRAPKNETRDEIVKAIRAEPIYCARILTGDLPTEIEKFFTSRSLDLFPGGKIADGQYDMKTRCNCPDYANPCKHSFAVLFILGEEISRDPSLLLKLRGLTMEELCR